MDLSEGGGGGSGMNPLVALLALGGVGSSAPKQMQLDSDTDAEADQDDEQEPKPKGNDRRALAEQAAWERKRRAKADEADRRRHMLAKQRAQKQHLVASDPLIHFIYMPEAGAMTAIARVLKEASERWRELQATAPSSPLSLSTFLRAFPSALLIECVDFLSFLCLRHSVVFQRFALQHKLFDTLASFFPTPVLTPQEIERERQLEERRAKTETKVEPTVKAEAPSLDLGVISPSPSPSPPPAAQGAFPPPSFVPTLTLPTPVLCACLRFVRIAIEVDNKEYVAAVSHQKAIHGQ